MTHKFQNSIGLNVHNLRAHSKFLYVSGSPIFMNNEANTCVNIPSSNSTLSPIINPFVTYQEYIVCIDITVEYTADGFNISDDVRDIIDEMICIQPTDYILNVALTDERITIHTTEFFVCVNDTKQILIDYIKSIGGISEYEINLNCTSIESTIFEITELSGYGWDVYYEVIIGAVAVICCCYFAFAVMVYRSYKLNARLKEEQDAEIHLDNHRVLTSEIGGGWDILQEFRKNERISHTETEPKYKYHQNGYVRYGQPNMNTICEIIDNDNSNECEELSDMKQSHDDLTTHDRYCSCKDEQSFTNEDVGECLQSSDSAPILYKVNSDESKYDDKCQIFPLSDRCSSSNMAQDGDEHEVDYEDEDTDGGNSTSTNSTVDEVVNMLRSVKVAKGSQSLYIL